MYDNVTGEVIAIADAKGLNITQGEVLYSPTFESPSLENLGLSRKPTKRLTIEEVWRKLIRDHVRLYRDGLLKLDGCFGHSVTFTLLKLPEDKIKSATRQNGQLKKDFTRKLAEFMARNRSKSNLSNMQLIICGITRILSENTS